MDNKYQKQRKEVLGFFQLKNRTGESERIYSPSGNFYLIIYTYRTREGAWDYTQGVVKSSKSDKVIADVKRNFSHFWHSWIQHTNGNEYLLCGEDYQGQTVINLTKETVRNYFPEAGYDGHGFCWVNAIPSANCKVLAVVGCYWACPYDVVFFDFSSPDELPFKELKRIEDIGEVKGWDEQNNFVVDREVEIRKSDSKPYHELTEEEQDELDNTPELSDYKKVQECIGISDIQNRMSD